MSSVPSARHASLRAKIAGALFLLTLVVTMLFGTWPEVFVVGTDGQQGLKAKLAAPVHATDDVMISLRSGMMLKELGIPAFNRHDLAEASTSFASPALFAGLLTGMSDNHAVASYLALGLMAAAATLALMAWRSPSPSAAMLVAVSLLLTRTHLDYALNGWDHIFETFFLTWSTYLLLAPRLSPVGLVTLSVCAAMGCAFRPDALLISVALIVATWVRHRPHPLLALSLLLAPFALLLGSMLEFNFAAFGEFTPTTARLKLGAAPSLGYALKYVVQNGLASYTALSLIPVLLVVLGLFGRAWGLRGRGTGWVVAACVLTTLASMYNSDVFPGARMFWAPACVLATLLLSQAPPVPGWAQAWESSIAGWRTLHHKLQTGLPGGMARLCAGAIALFFFSIVTGDVVLGVRDRWRAAMIDAQEVPTSRTAQQYLIASWMNTHLKPADGSVGFFYLGVSYHMPHFEAADFLGKADELIARSPVRWGPPGHNKWNIDRTLDKWHPQAIIPPEPSDPGDAQIVQGARAAMSVHRDYGFAPDLVLNARVQSDYAYCYLKFDARALHDSYGFFLRKDLVGKHGDSLSCNEHVGAHVATAP